MLYRIRLYIYTWKSCISGTCLLNRLSGTLPEVWDFLDLWLFRRFFLCVFGVVKDNDLRNTNEFFFLFCNKDIMVKLSPRKSRLSFSRYINVPFIPISENRDKRDFLLFFRAHVWIYWGLESSGWFLYEEGQIINVGRIEACVYWCSAGVWVLIDTKHSMAKFIRT